MPRSAHPQTTRGSNLTNTASHRPTGLFSPACRTSGGPMPPTPQNVEQTQNPQHPSPSTPSTPPTPSIPPMDNGSAGAKATSRQRPQRRPRTLAEAAGGAAKLSPFTLVLPRKAGVARDPVRLRVDFHDE